MLWYLTRCTPACHEFMKTHVFIYPGGEIPESPSSSTSFSVLPGRVPDAAAALAGELADPALETVVFWDTRCGQLPWDSIGRFERSLDDVWHAGISGAGGADLLSHAAPLAVYRPDPRADLDGGINWKLDLRATLIRARVLRAVGSLDPTYETLSGAARELGYRLLRRGAVCRQQPNLVTEPPLLEPRPLADDYRLLRQYFNSKWTAYTLARRLMRGGAWGAEVAAWRHSANVGPRTKVPTGALLRDVSGVWPPARPSVSVILPTFGRYRYVAEVLDDLRAQTIKPTQILIADGNAVEDRQPEVYENYRDLPIEILWHTETGICSGRNACLQKVTGDHVWFVDDDSRIGPDNLEAHFRVMQAYGADVSVGPAYTKSRPELHGDQREVMCTHMDCGTTLCTASLLRQVGGFDMEFNQYLAGEDGELGIRFVRAGGLMVNNPFAQRFHYVAPVGGSRTSKRSVHRFTRWSLVPRPVQSIYYTAKRYYEPHTALDAMVQGSVLAGWRRREGVPATRAWKMKTLLGELAAVPVTIVRLYRSVQAGRDMVEQGPMIPELARHADARSVTR
ncbi:hypothetical protein BH11MYX1_BH11MYX1_45800 [soil metagenome]